MRPSGQRGLQDSDSFIVDDPATKTDLICRINTAVRTKADETYSDRMLGNLFYGYVEKTDLKHLPAGSVNTVIIPLVKNTNNIRVLLQSINSDINLTPEQFDFAIYDINAQLGWNDEIVNPAPLTYNPFNTKQGSVKLNDGTEVLTAAVAELKEVFNVPLVDYFLMVKGHYSRPMSDQEYLDRQDDYAVVVFLEHKEGPSGEFYIAARIYINGWQIVLSNPDISW